MEIRISIQSAIILLLTVLVLTMGAYFYRSYELQTMSRQIQQTQQVLLSLGVDEKVAQIFNNIGYQVNVQKPAAAVAPVVDSKISGEHRPNNNLNGR